MRVRRVTGGAHLAGMRKNPTSPTPAASAPVSLRSVVLDVQPDGSMTVTINGAPHPPPENTGAWSRKMFPQIIDQASDERAVPQKKEKRTPGRPVLVEVTGDGFVPGEDIAIAVIVSHTDATGTGAARALLDKRQLDTVLPEADGAGEVVLYGRISGTTVIRRVP